MVALPGRRAAGGGQRFAGPTPPRAAPLSLTRRAAGPRCAAKSGLKASAKPFSFNPGASSFVPKATAPAPAPAPEPAPAPAPAAEAEAAPEPAPAPAPAAASENGPADGTADLGAVEVEVTPEPAGAASGAGAAAKTENSDDKSSASGAAGAAGETGDETETDEEETDELRAARAKMNAAWLEAMDKREHLNVVLIGHVDAGKSTTSGNLLYLTGMVEQRIIDKFEREAKQRNRESWFMAFIMDTSDEERAKGKTVEVGRAYFATENKRFTILDAPGHKNYVPNMVQGASQADVAVLVISARRGEFEAGFDRSGQTREHALLAKTLGVSKLVVAVNKMDEPTVKWSEERYQAIIKKLRPFLKGCGFKVKQDVTFLPMSGLTGENVKDPPKGAPWYSGPTLMQVLDGVTIAGRDSNAPLRIPVLDRFNDRGTIVMGKVEMGVVGKGLKVRIMPTNKRTEVTTVMLDETTEVEAARPGENIRLRLKGINDEDIQRGYVICPLSSPCATVHQFEAQVLLLNLLDHCPILTVGYRAVIHAHTAQEECVVTKLLSCIDQSKKGPDGKPVVQRNPRFAKSHFVVNMRLRVARSIPVDTFDQTPQLGRFTLRDEGRTIAIGKITRLPRDKAVPEKATK